MSPLEKRTYAMLAVSAALFAWFLARMLDGWVVAEQNATELWFVYFVVLTVAAIAYPAISAIASATGGAVARDERDDLIENRAARNELFALAALVNVALFQAIANESFPNHIFPIVDLSHTPTLVFVLFAALWIGEFVRLISILIYARR